MVTVEEDLEEEREPISDQTLEVILEEFRRGRLPYWSPPIVFVDERLEKVRVRFLRCFFFSPPFPESFSAFSFSAFSLASLLAFFFASCDK